MTRTVNGTGQGRSSATDCECTPRAPSDPVAGSGPTPSLLADLLALRQSYRARRRLSRTPQTEELRDDTARATRAWTADHAPRPRRAHLGFDGNAVEARPRATRRILHAVEESYTISHLTLREWGGAAYYMAGKSSMTSFAMSCKCSSTSSVPCHIVVSWYVTP